VSVRSAGRTDRGALPRQLVNVAGFRLLDVQEGDFGLLCREAADDGLADARASARDQHRLAGQIAVGRCHRRLLE
jgi:hypothetical protein